MSIFLPAALKCPKCGAETDVQRNASVNVDRRPDLRVAILDGSFQSEACGECGTALRLPPHLTLLDLGRNQWIMAEPVSLLEQWQAAEADARTTYAETFGDDASPAARELAKDLKPRLVFGWPALREKLFAHDLGLDDVTLELLKIAIMREVDKPPMADQTELRLVGGDAKTLNFLWVVAETEAPLAALPVPREIYDDVAGDLEAWALLRVEFEGKLFVDLRRLTAGAG
jgi:hypothetical protein